MKTIARNKRAYFDYGFDKFWEAGIVLLWHEVKSIKTWHVNLTDSVALFDKQELWLRNMDIQLYKKTAPAIVSDYKPKRNRKLLLNHNELGKIFGLINKPGNVIIPLEIFLNKRGLIKLKLWVGKLKRKVEKKQILKEKDQRRQMNRDIRNYTT